MPRGFISDNGFEEYIPAPSEPFTKDRNEIKCLNCNSTYAPMPLDPRKVFTHWECFGCYKTISRKDIFHAIKRAAAALQKEIPEVKIIPLLQSIRIESNVLVGNDRRTVKREKLSELTVWRVNSEMVKLVSHNFNIKIKRLKDLTY